MNKGKDAPSRMPRHLPEAVMRMGHGYISAGRPHFPLLMAMVPASGLGGEGNPWFPPQALFLLAGIVISVLVLGFGIAIRNGLLRSEASSEETGAS